LVVSLVLLQFYIIPKIRIKELISRLRGNRVPTISHLIANATIRWLSQSLSIHQFRAMTVGDVDVESLLRNFSESLEGGFEYEYVSVPDFRAWHLVRCPSSTQTIMYVHGGGFVSGSPSSVSSYLLQLHLELRTRGILFDVVAVEYDLAPEFPYPHALQQIVSAYEHIQSQSKPVVLMGDSAGGNLCLALLRHLAYPHPNIAPSDASQNGSEGITAVCLASPWADLRTKHASYPEASFDCLDKYALNSWRDAYLGSRPLDEYASALGCLTSHRWKNILPPNMLLMSGELDYFLPEISSLVHEVRKV
ncbi:Alpha/Beta hydrolase protein, partial [Dactylonectria macrodidyma]